MVETNTEDGITYWRHPGAYVHPTARIGPYSVISNGAKIGANVEIQSHAVILGPTKIGHSCRIFPFTTLGLQPIKEPNHDEKPATLDIGEKCIIREHTTIHAGVQTTSLGSKCMVMSGCNIGHDCVIGNGVIIASNTSIAGHVRIDDHAIIGGGSGVHQFVQIGKRAMIGGLSAVEDDVIPYGLVLGNRSYLRGLNLIGLRRMETSLQERKALLKAYRYIFEHGSKDGMMIIRERAHFISELLNQNSSIVDGVDLSPAKEKILDIVNFIFHRQSIKPRSLTLPKLLEVNVN